MSAKTGLVLIAALTALESSLSVPAQSGLSFSCVPALQRAASRVACAPGAAAAARGRPARTPLVPLARQQPVEAIASAPHRLTVARAA